VALVGLRGAGKSSLGRLLAGELGRSFVDLDEELARAAGCASAGALLRERGEAGFRDLEQACLARTLEGSEPLVLATGGGVVERAANRELLLARALVVWLRARPEELERRTALDASERPPLQAATGAASEAEALLARRAAWYAELARLELVTDGRAQAELARALAEELRALG